MAGFALCFPSPSVGQELPDEIQPYGMASLTSEHFVVRYPENTERYAHRAIDYAEHAYRLLSEQLQVEMDGRMTIQLLDRIDNNDYYRASADLSDFFLIYLWPSQSVLQNAYHGAWLEEEIATHIARLLVQRTYVDFIHSYNNMLLPSWYLDGIASYYEVPDHPGKPFQRGIMNAIIRDTARYHAFPKLETLIAGNQSWLGSEIGKIYGTAFLDYIVHKFGIDMLVQWNHENASSFASIDEIAEALFGQSWQSLYDQWVQVLQADYEDAPDEGLSFNKDYISTLWRNELPQSVPGRHAVSYVREDGAHPRAIVLHDLDTDVESVLAECHGRCEHHWSPDGKRLYFTSRIRTSRYESESLYSLNVDDIFPRKVPVPGHIRSFAVDGEYIILVCLVGDQPQVYRFNTKDASDIRLVYTAPPFSLIEGITPVADNQWAASMYHPMDRQFNLVLFENTQGAFNLTKLTHDDDIEMFPFRGFDGNIGYVTEKYGIYHLNVIRPDGTGHHVIYTHTGGMLQPDQAEDGSIYYTDVNYNGMAIARLASDQFRWDAQSENALPYPSSILPRLPFSIRSPRRLEEGDFAQPMSPGSLVSGDGSDLDGPEPGSIRENSVIPVETSRYNGPDWPVLIPDSYMPMFGTSDATGWFLGLGIENYDYLKHHKYHIHFAWFFDRNAADLELTYRWSRYRWWLSGSIGVKQKTQIIDFGDSYRYYPHTNYWAYLSTGSSWHYPYLDILFSLKILAEYTKTNDHSLDEVIQGWVDRTDAAVNPADMHEMWSNALIAELELRHLHEVPQSLPGKTGYTLWFESRIEMPFWGNQCYTFANRIKLDLSWSMPWRFAEVIALSFFYGFAWSESDYRYSLELLSGSGFSFNDMVDFHGIRAGNLIANNHLLHAQIRYTAPLFVIRKNPIKIPFAFNRIGVGVLGDWALKSDKYFKPNITASMWGLGAEIYIDGTIGYNYPLHLGVGYEKGYAERGEDAFYLWVGM